MSISTKLKELLDDSGVVYQHGMHPVAYTTRETAESMHSPKNEMVKTIIVNADGLLRMAVLPANCMLDLKHMKFITRSQNIRLATEAEMKDGLPDCELDAIPPFGDLFGLPVYCDVRLEEIDSIEFNDGTPRDTIRMDFQDFKRIASPTVTDIVDHYPSRAA